MKDFFDKILNGKYTKRILLSALLGVGAAFVYFYFFLPPINLRAIDFWIYLTVVVIAAAYPFLGLKVGTFVEERKTRHGRKYKKSSFEAKF